MHLVAPHDPLTHLQAFAEPPFFQVAWTWGAAYVPGPAVLNRLTRSRSCPLVASHTACVVLARPMSCSQRRDPDRCFQSGTRDLP